MRCVSLCRVAVPLAMYASMYAPQPILPLLSRSPGIAPAVASLAISAMTLALAGAMLIAGSLTDAFGPKP